MLLRERTKIVATDGFDVSPLLAIHRCGSGLHVARCTGCGLDEAKHIFVPSNKIDFSVMPRGAVISRNHYISTPAEIEVGIFFASAAGSEVRGGLVLSSFLSDAIQKSNG